MFRAKLRDNEAMAMRLAALAELPGIDLMVDGPGAEVRRERAMFFGIAFGPIDVAALDETFVAVRPRRWRLPALRGAVESRLRRGSRSAALMLANAGWRRPQGSVR